MHVAAVLLTAVITFLTILYLILKQKYNYWRKKNVPHLPPTMLFGNYGDFILQKQNFGDKVMEICKKFPKEPYVGAFIGTEPTLIVQDPEMIGLITSTEFSHFNSRDLMDFMKKDTFGQSLIFSYGEHWRFARTKLNPIFTSSKLKSMFPLLESCAIDFAKYINTEVKGEPIEAKQMMASYTMATVVSCALGIDLKNFGEQHVFKEMGKMFFEVNWLRGAALTVRQIWPSLFYGLGFQSLPKDLTIFFRKLLTEVFESRGHKPSPRNDFVDALLNLKQEKGVDEEFIIAQCIAIFAGGFETSATTMSFALFELAKNEDMQDKVHKEINERLKETDGRITYECMTKMLYLDACIKETLRIYPIFGVITREVTSNYTLPSGVELDRGLRIHLPVYHLHHHPDYFPDPEVFRPERFYGDQKQTIKPASYLPFGEGPRACIGKRFGILQTQLGLTTLLRKHKVVLAEGMSTKLEWDPSTFTTQCKTGIYLRFIPREGITLGNK